MSMEPKHSHLRYGLLDTLRGLCVLSMAAFHGVYDLVNILGVPMTWFHGTPGYLWQQSICWTFILLSGLCWNLSRRHLFRGLLLTACGAAVTLATWLVMPSELILYGILTLLGLSALLLNLLHTLFQKLHWEVPPPMGFAVSLLLFFLLREVPGGYLGFEGLRFFALPAELYRFPVLTLLGFPPAGFSSSDYFPLIPWFFLYLAGYFLWKLLSRQKKVLEALQHPGLRPLSFVGRHSLLIYLLHQPVLLGIFLLFQAIGG